MLAHLGLLKRKSRASVSGSGLLCVWEVGEGRTVESTCRHARSQLSQAVSWLPEAVLKIPFAIALCLISS